MRRPLRRAFVVAAAVSAVVCVATVALWAGGVWLHAPDGKRLQRLPVGARLRTTEFGVSGARSS